MNTVPIAFAFDNNLVMPACICLSSLMMNAKENTFYDIFILHSTKEKLKKEQLKRLPEFYPNCKIQFREIGDYFDNSFEIRGITTPAYYRLVIPEVIPEYDKVIYSDVDVIFRMDLADLYYQPLEGYYLAATRDLGLNYGTDGEKYIKSIGIEKGFYLQSGFIILNSKLLRDKDLTTKFRQLSSTKLKYQDQDILNIVCKGKVKYLPLQYNMTDYSVYYAMNNKSLLLKLFTDNEITVSLETGNIHFNGHKPWKKYAVNFDIWWEYYRKSPYYDEKFYFEFFYSKLDELDQLSLGKRLKILARYFIVGRKQS